MHLNIQENPLSLTEQDLSESCRDRRHRHRQAGIGEGYYNRPDGQAFKARTLEVSQGGARIVSACSLEVGDELCYVLRSCGRLLSGTAKIAWVSRNSFGGCVAGLAFHQARR